MCTVAVMVQRKFIGLQQPSTCLVALGLSFELRSFLGQSLSFTGC